MDEITRGLFSFIEQSPTAFHAVENARSALEEAGYRPLLESGEWTLEPGQGYYVTRNQSSLMAFRVPEHIRCVMAGAAHTDSPCLKLKDHMELRPEGYTKLDAEKYGGMLMGPWLDRPLSVAGRLMTAGSRGVESKLVNIDRDLMVIPSLAIHMDRTVNDGKKLDAQTDLSPLLGKGEPELLQLLAEEAGVRVEDIVSFDLFVYNRDRGSTLGAEEEFILCPRLDDLQCVYGLLQGFLGAEPKEGTMPLLALFDNEEIGSETRQGAMSTFLQDTLRRIFRSRGLGEDDYLRCLARSLMVSADNAHGVHPNHPEKAALTNRPRLGEGVVLKYGARYATDGPSAAIFRTILSRAGVPVQTYYNHSNVPGGGTLGNISITQASFHTVDVGLAQLAMHSACETAGRADTEYLIRAMRAVYSSALEETGPETFALT